MDLTPDQFDLFYPTVSTLQVLLQEAKNKGCDKFYLLNKYIEDLGQLNRRVRDHEAGYILLLLQTAKWGVSSSNWMLPQPVVSETTRPIPRSIMRSQDPEFVKVENACVEAKMIRESMRNSFDIEHADIRALLQKKIREEKAEEQTSFRPNEKKAIDIAMVKSMQDTIRIADAIAETESYMEKRSVEEAIKRSLEPVSDVGTSDEIVPSMYKPVMADNKVSHYERKSVSMNPYTQVKNYDPDEMPSTSSALKKTQFRQEDPLFPVFMTMFIRIGIADSDIVKCVKEYYERATQIVDEDPSKYLDLIGVIQKCFEKEGWDFSAESGGFKTEPKRERLMDNLQKICDDYLSLIFMIYL